MPSIDVSGVMVNFPFEPYQCQMAYMEKMITALKLGQNAILESPTGTGKTLCLLCSSLAWLEDKKAQIGNQRWRLANSDAGPGQALDEYRNVLTGQLDAAVGSWDGELAAPKIIFASRTHSQLTQAIQELKRTAYRHFKVCVLGSREQLCIHPQVMKEESNAAKVHLCRAKVQSRTCHFYNQLDATKNNFSNQVLDIEDLVTLGTKHNCCPYYAARELKAEADVIFMPYNYLLDVKSRRAHGVELQGNIVIFDEAHNLERICEESASFDLSSADIAAAMRELSELADKVLEWVKEEEMGGGVANLNDSQMAISQDFNLKELLSVKAMLSQLEEKMDAIPLPKRTEGVTKPGMFMFDLLKEINLTFETKTPILELVEKAITHLTNESTSSIFHSRGAGLSKFADVIKLVFSREMDANTLMATTNHQAKLSQYYKVHIRQEEPKKTKKSDGWGTAASSSSKVGRILSYWCFSPGHAMEDLRAHGVKSIILTSGTLSPLSSFKSEMGMYWCTARSVGTTRDKICSVDIAKKMWNPKRQRYQLIQGERKPLKLLSTANYDEVQKAAAALWPEEDCEVDTYVGKYDESPLPEVIDGEQFTLGNFKTKQPGGQLSRLYIFFKPAETPASTKANESRIHKLSTAQDTSTSPELDLASKTVTAATSEKTPAATASERTTAAEKITAATASEKTTAATALEKTTAATASEKTNAAEKITAATAAEKTTTAIVPETITGIIPSEASTVKCHLKVDTSTADTPPTTFKEQKISITYMCLRKSKYSDVISTTTVHSVSQALGIFSGSPVPEEIFDPLEEGFSVKDIFLNDIPVVVGKVVGNLMSYEISQYDILNPRVKGVIYGPDSLHGREVGTNNPVLITVLDSLSSTVSWTLDGETIKTENDTKVSIMRPANFGSGLYSIRVDGVAAGEVYWGMTVPHNDGQSCPGTPEESNSDIETDISQKEDVETHSVKADLCYSTIEEKDLTIGEFLKKGGMGTVYRAKYLGSEVAAKEIRLSGRHKKKISQAVMKEVEIHSKLHCKHIAQLIGLCNSKICHYIVTELVSGPDLDTLIFDEIEEYKELSEETLELMAGDMSRAVAYLHGQDPPIVHQDIKLGNFVMERETKRVKLIDLGISRIRNTLTMGQTAYSPILEGTLSYMPPEKILYKRKGSEHGDIWSLGCCLIELFSGKDIWELCTEIDGEDPDTEHDELEALMLQQVQPHGLNSLVKHCHYKVLQECVSYSKQRPTAVVLSDTFS